MSDPAKYRSREEVQAVRDKSDALEHLKKVMLDAGITEEKFKDIDKEIRAIVAESADFAESAPEPELPDLYTDVLVEQY
jgi:pyruvate dehydrogenase E1 component alpha subunit